MKEDKEETQEENLENKSEQDASARNENIYTIETISEEDEEAYQRASDYNRISAMKLIDQLDEPLMNIKLYSRIQS